MLVVVVSSLLVVGAILAEPTGKRRRPANRADYQESKHDYVVAHFWDRGPGFESSASHNDPDALQDHCVIM